MLSPSWGKACGSAGHIFDGILGIKSCIKVMPTLKFVVPGLWHEPELISCFLGTSLVVAAYDFPSRDGIAGAGGGGRGANFYHRTRPV